MASSPRAQTLRQAALEQACAHMHACAAAQTKQQFGMLHELQLAAWGWTGGPPNGMSAAAQMPFVPHLPQQQAYPYQHYPQQAHAPPWRRRDA